MTTFVVCYLVFVFFPVAGPYYVFPRPPPWFVDNPPARLVYATLAAGSSYGAAFPSLARRGHRRGRARRLQGSRRLGLLLVVPTILLAVGVVYCQMHYGVDALAGCGVGLVVAAGGGNLTAGRTGTLSETKGACLEARPLRFTQA